MNKEWIPVFVSIIALTVFVIVYLDYTTQTLQEEELSLSVYFLQNVTSIDNTSITLDFVDEKMVFESTLYVEGNGIVMESTSKGFQNNDRNCKENLDIVSKDGSERGRTWHDNLRIPFDGFGEIEYIEMKKTCDFQDKLSPNGEFRIHLFGKDQSVGMDIDKIPFTMIFDSDKYRCNDFCIFSEHFKLLDIEKRDKITTLRAEAVNPQTTSMRVDLRTDNLEAEQRASIFFILIQVGIGATLTMVVYALTSIQQKKSQEILSEVHAIGLTQQKIIDEQNEFRKIKTDFVNRRLSAGFYMCKEGLLARQSVVDAINKEQSTPERLKRIDMFNDNFSHIVERLGRIIDSSSDVLDPKIIAEIDFVGSLIINYCETEFTDETLLKSYQKAYDGIMKLSKQFPWAFSDGSTEL